ncbi:MAG: DUF4402 domain-containing protein [Ignavibacteriae bacterium]|nr:DUF4402 domain-containing protein [Ignavibacteriota bacterium]
MKKIFIVFTLISLTSLFAQQTGYISGNASANLIQPLSIEAGSGDLDFGEIIVSGSSFIEKIEPNFGKQFIVTGHPGKNITVRFSSVELTNYDWASNFGGNFGTLIFTPNVETKNSQKILDGNTLPLAQNGLIGELQIFVGGEIYINPKQEIGDYVGLFVLSVTY